MFWAATCFLPPAPPYPPLHIYRPTTHSQAPPEAMTKTGTNNASSVVCALGMSFLFPLCFFIYQLMISILFRFYVHFEAWEFRWDAHTIAHTSFFFVSLIMKEEIRENTEGMSDEEEDNTMLVDPMFQWCIGLSVAVVATGSVELKYWLCLAEWDDFWCLFNIH
jgi:hypothetical protein